MGEVYRARDTSLNRDVAIKVLPEAFASDPERLVRFKREAHVLASLNHPHIGAIYGLEDADGVRALVLELVDGETLADRIARGPIPLTDALTISRQVTDALDAAHEKGIVHRDLKPANIKITPDGVVKVLDFGLARIVSANDGSTFDSRRPTITIEETREGLVMGTAAYMSPEQARGKAVDKRTDIWAFGCVLYEALTGRVAFAGETLSDTIASILEREPDWRALPDATPANIRRLLQRCLEKDVKHRLRDIGDARVELDEAAIPPLPTATTANVRVDSTRARLGGLVLLVSVAAVGFVTWLMLRADRPPQEFGPQRPITRFDVVTPPTGNLSSFALSPDGRQLAFVGMGEGGSRLWVRAFDQATARPLPGADGASFPFWAPDGRSIGFFADGKLKRVNLAGSGPQVLADASAGRGGAWNRDGELLFAPVTPGSLMRIPATGGAPVPATQLESGQTSHRWPQFLADGRHFLFLVAQGRPETRGTYFGSLDGGAPTRVLPDETPAVYVPPETLLVVRQGVLMALRFDPTRGVVSGEPVPVVQGVATDVVNYRSAFTVSPTGVLAYRTGSGSQRRQLVWMDRAGRVPGTVGGPDGNNLRDPALAPDGERVAVGRTVQGNGDVWLVDVARGVASRLTSDPNVDYAPVWSPDGRRVAFRSARNGVYDLFEKPASGAGDEQSLLVTLEGKAPVDWSPDGRTLLYTSLSPKTGSDLWALPLGGNGKPFPIVQTAFDELDAQVSPNGRWLAYVSNESGRFEIYGRPFPGPGGRWPVSTAGGSQPRWRPDGKELFYVVPGGHLMAAPIGVTSDGQTLQPGAPVALFAARLASGSGIYTSGYQEHPQYAVARDGRFLLNVAVESDTTPPISIVLNWDAALKK